MPPRIFQYRTELIWRRVVVKVVLLALVMLYFYLVQAAFAQWWDYVIAAIGAWYLVEVVLALRIALKPVPKVVISNEGIEDPKIGDLIIPWSAIKEIRTYNSGSMFGGAFILADYDMLDVSKLSLINRYAPLFRFGHANKDNVIPLLMTVPVALKESLEDVMAEIESRPAAGQVRITH